MLNPDGRTGERGASAVLIAASALFLIGMAAIATDVGAGFNERRNAQSAADTAVVGGALWSIISPAANPLQDALDQAKAITDSNTPQPLAQADWDACTDAGALAIDSTTPALGLTGGSNCVSWSQGFSTMRVRVPTQTTDTAFGGVLGLSQLTTSAVAEASISGLGTGGMIPSGALGSLGPGAEFCIKSSSTASGSCGTSSTGDFQNFKPYFYTEIAPGNPTSMCTSGEQGLPIARAFADGIDHYFGAAAAIPGVRRNGANCPGFGGPPLPDRVDSAAGYQNNDITRGLVTGGDWDGVFAGRLDRGPYQSNPLSAGFPAFEIFTNTIDNKPLWSHIDTSLSPLHQDCVAVSDLPDHPQFSTGPVTVSTPNALGKGDVVDWDEAMVLLQSCLTNHSTVLFDQDALLQSPRVASAPRFWQTTTLPSNACCYDIRDFVPVFIQSLWTEHSSQWTCSGEVESVAGSHCKHVPGMTGDIAVSAPGQQRVDSASALILNCAHLSDDVCDSVQTSTGGTTTFIFDIELTK